RALCSSFVTPNSERMRSAASSRWRTGSWGAVMARPRWRVRAGVPKPRARAKRGRGLRRCSSERRLPPPRRFELLGSGATALGLQLQCLDLALKDADNTRHSGHHTARLQNRGLYGLSVAAVRGVEGKDARDAAQAQTLKDGALDRGFG